MLYINNFSFKFVLKFKVFQQIKSYVTFLLKSTNEHGVHSPFVFNLVTRCFYKKTDEQLLNSLLKYRQELIKTDKKIEIKDFGAGSKYFKGNKRAIHEIAKKAGISKKYASLLIRFTAYFKPNTILEIGTSLGLSAYSMQLGNPNSTIITLEGCEETAKVAQEKLHHYNTNTQLIVGNFSVTLPKITKNKQFDLIFFDGNHAKNPTISYFEHCLTTIHNDSIFIFDDIHWSKDMELAWEYIKNHPTVTVTIDTYQWGIVFFRKEQEKEHFTIRI